MFAVTYDAATFDAGKAASGARELMAYCLAAYPDATNLGIYAPRDQRGSSALSVHAEGRAIDVGFPYTGAAGHPEGQALCAELVNNHAALGVQCVIYARRIWSTNRPTWRPYSGSDPHTGHIHIELTRQAAAGLTGPMIDAALGGGKAMADVITLPASRRANLREIQLVLKDAGFYAGPLDADPGPDTLAAVHALKNHARAVEHQLAMEQDAPLHDYAELRRDIVAVLDRYAA